MEDQIKIAVTSKWLTEQGMNAADVNAFCELFPEGTAPLPAVLEKLQYLLAIDTKYLFFCVKLIELAPKTQKALVLDKLPDGSVVIYNGDVYVKDGMSGNCIIISSGNLAVDGYINLFGNVYIFANQVNVKLANFHKIVELFSNKNLNIKQLNVLWDAEFEEKFNLIDDKYSKCLYRKQAEPAN